MQYTREQAVSRLLESYKTYYNITDCPSGPKGLRAVCEFYERSEKFVLSKKAELWSADCEEFIYLFDVPELTLSVYEECRDFAYNDGMERSHIGPGHMYTYITAVFICDTCTPEAKKLLKKCRIYKSFHFSLHGWMDFHTVLIQRGASDFPTNRSGKSNAKFMKNIFMKKNKKKRRV